MVFGSVEEFEKFVLDKCRDAVSETEQEVHQVMESNVNQFYGEYSPREYNRTGAFSESLQKTGVMSTGNGFEAEVYFNEVSWPSVTVGQSGMLHTKDKSDGEILANNLTGGAPHGWYAGGTPVWNASLSTLGDIKGLLLSKLNL